MAIFSKMSQNATVILTYIAQSGMDQVCAMRDVSKATGISEPTVAKTLQLLVKEGFLASKKGPGGGFQLLISPDLITLGRIVRAVEGRELLSECVPGLSSCSKETICPLHEKWESAKQELVDFLDSTTLQEMISAVVRKNAVSS